MSQIGSDINNIASDGTYKLNSAYTWFVLIGGTLVVLFLLVGAALIPLDGTIAASEQLAHPRILLAGDVVLCAWLITAIGSVAKLSRQTLRVDSERITVTNSHGDQIESLRWTELSKVTASHKMSQLVLWDGQGNRRVAVDRNIDNFQQIRSRVLAEYAKIFTAAPLPFEFRRAKFWTPDAIVCVGAAFVMGLMSFSVYRNGQPGSGVLLFLSFELLFSLYFLSINPQFFGPSQILQDRIELNGVLKRSVVFKRDITSVEIVDFTAGQAGTSSMVLVTPGPAKPLKILQRYGDLPEIYLTIKAWLAG